MKLITSIADFYNKVKDDENYKLALIRSCRKSLYIEDYPSYEESLEWLEDWISYNNGENNCSIMVNFINSRIKEIPIYPKKLLSANNINVFVGTKNPYLPTFFNDK